MLRLLSVCFPGGQNSASDPRGSEGDGSQFWNGAPHAAARPEAETGPAGEVRDLRASGLARVKQRTQSVDRALLPQVSHHGDHAGGGRAGLHRDHRGEGRLAAQDDPNRRRAEEHHGEHVRICGHHEGVGAAAGTLAGKTPAQLLECVISSLTAAHASSNKPLRVKGHVTTLSLRGHGTAVDAVKVLS